MLEFFSGTAKILELYPKNIRRIWTAKVILSNCEKTKRKQNTRMIDFLQTLTQKKKEEKNQYSKID